MDLVQVETRPHTHETPVETTANGIPLPPTPIILTEKAAEKVREAMAQEGLADHGLRVGVIGGGCSGLQYLLDFSPAPGDLDFTSTQHGVPVYVDPFSAAHLRGTQINYVDGLSSSGFKFENPNTVRACGCGQSFQT